MVKPRGKRLIVNEPVVRVCDGEKTVLLKEQVITMGARTKETPEEFLRGKNSDQVSKESTPVSTTATTETETVPIVSKRDEEVAEVESVKKSGIGSPATMTFSSKEAAGFYGLIKGAEGMIKKIQQRLISSCDVIQDSEKITSTSSKLSSTRSSSENEIEEGSRVEMASKKGNGKGKKKKVAAEVETSESESKGNEDAVEPVAPGTSFQKNARAIRCRKTKAMDISDGSKATKKGKAKKTPTAPARVSPRLNGRKASGSVNLEPLEERIRFHELIQRSVELRDPATKLLFMASLGLFPKSDLKCDTTPYVVIQKEVTSPGGKSSEPKIVEVPLMPDWMTVEELEDCQRSEDGLLLQIAPSSSSLPLTANEGRSSPLELPAKKSTSRKSPSPPIAVTPPPIEAMKEEEGQPPAKKIKPRSKSKPKVSQNSEIVQEQKMDVDPHPQQLLPSVSPVGPPEAPKSVTEPMKQKPSAGLKKRKSLETITREITKSKAESAVQAVLPLPIDESVTLPLRIDVPSENKPENFTSSISQQRSQKPPPASQSSNPILLEELTKKPVKKRAPKRKLANVIVPQTYETNSPDVTYVENPVSFTVSVHPDSVLPTGEIKYPIWNKNKTNEPAKSRNKKSTPLLPQPMHLPHSPLPRAFSNYASLPSDTESTVTPKPQQPKRVRAKKTDAGASSAPPNKPAYLVPMDADQHPITSLYHASLSNHREFRIPAALSFAVPVPALVSQNHSDPNVALDFRMKTLAACPVRPTNKSTKVYGTPQSILKPISEIVMSNDSPSPLDLAVNRPELSIRLASKPLEKEKGSEPLKPLPDNVTVINGFTKTQTSLDNFKQKLARLDTNIVPAVFDIE